MLTIQEIHNRIFQQLQNAGAFAVDTYLPEEIDLAIQKAEDQFIRQRMINGNDPLQQGFHAIAKRADDLRTITKETNVVVTDNYAPYPSDYMYFADATANKEGCTGLVTDLVPPDYSDKIQDNPFRRTQNNKVNVSLMENGIRVWGSSGLITSLDLIYIRILNKVSLASGITSELSAHQEIINLAVADLLERSQSPRTNTVLTMNDRIT